MLLNHVVVQVLALKNKSIKGSAMDTALILISVGLADRVAACNPATGVSTLLKSVAGAAGPMSGRRQHSQQQSTVLADLQQQGCELLQFEGHLEEASKWLPGKWKGPGEILDLFRNELTTITGTVDNCGFEAFLHVRVYEQ